MDQSIQFSPQSINYTFIDEIGLQEWQDFTPAQRQAVFGHWRYLLSSPAPNPFRVNDRRTVPGNYPKPKKSGASVYDSLVEALIVQPRRIGVIGANVVDVLLIENRTDFVVRNYDVYGNVLVPGFYKTNERISWEHFSANGRLVGTFAEGYWTLDRINAYLRSFLPAQVTAWMADHYPTFVPSVHRRPDGGHIPSLAQVDSLMKVMTGVPVAIGIYPVNADPLAPWYLVQGSLFGGYLDVKVRDLDMHGNPLPPNHLSYNGVIKWEHLCEKGRLLGRFANSGGDVETVCTQFVNFCCMRIAAWLVRNNPALGCPGIDGPERPPGQGNRAP